jgi:exonuclease SbcC
MRPVKLTMKAFGPYNANENIDFRKLEDNNLFLITGNTGSGKTTIFDAITYALFGEASSEDRDDKNLISDFASEDEITQIIFDFSLSGKYYRVLRTPEQQRKKQRGEGYTKQPASASLYEIDEGGKELNLLTSRKITDTTEKIKELIGLDANQFKQIIMLPQGAFRELLTSKSDERQKILQRLFLTEKYQLFEDKLKNKEKKLNIKLGSVNSDIKHQIDEVKVSEEEENDFLELRSNTNGLDSFIEELQRFIEYKYIQKKQLRIEADKFNEQKALIETRISEAKLLLEKFSEREDLDIELKTLEEKNKEIKQVEEKIKLGKNALLVLDKELLLKQYREESAQKEKELVSITTHFEKTKEELEQIKQVNTKAETDWKPQLEQIKTQINTLKEYEKEVITVEAIQKEAVKQKARIENIEKEIQKTDTAIVKQNSLISTIKSEINAVENLPEKKDLIISKLNKNKDEKFKNKMLTELLSQYELLSVKREKLAEEYKQHNSEAKKSKTEINNIIEQVKNLKELEKKNLAYTLAQTLTDEEPCPVCGSIHHPDPAKKSVEIEINKIEKLEAELEEKKTVTNQQLGTLKIILKNGTETREEMKRIWVKICEEKERQFEENEEMFNKLIENLSSKTKQTQEEFNHLSSEMNKINDSERILKANKIKEEKAEHELVLLREKKEILIKKSTLETTEYIKNETRLTAITEKVPEKYLTLSTLRQEIRIKTQSANNLDKNIKDCVEKLSKTNILFASLKTKKEEGQKHLNTLREKTEKQQKLFEASIVENNFDSVEAYHSAKMTKEVIKTGENNITAFRKLHDEKKNRFTFLNTELKEVQRPLLLELEEQKNTYEKKIVHTENRAVLINEQIQNNEKRLSALKDLNEKRGEIYKEYEVYGYLKNITSGKNAYRITFERFVQTAFLDDILISANQRLEKMTDGRYYLNRQMEAANLRSTSGLDIEVFDQYTGESRHVKTLSGGEGFKASLAMALGLSEVVQSYAGGVSLETLFIDEGFGSLDSESLDSAIKTLMELQSTGRLVGIISHVQELKERIDAYLEVIATKNGSYTRFHIP